MLFESFRFSTTLSEGSASLLPVGIIGIKKEPDASGEVYGETPEARATSDSKTSVADLLYLVNVVGGCLRITHTKRVTHTLLTPRCHDRKNEHTIDYDKLRQEKCLYPLVSL